MTGWNPYILIQHVPKSRGGQRDKRWSILVLIIVTVFSGGGRRTGLQPGEGYVNWQGGRLWYRIVGRGPPPPPPLLPPPAPRGEKAPCFFSARAGAGRPNNQQAVPPGRVGPSARN